jgi:hypothetical protein
MTRTLARRLATAGGTLGLAVLACAGTASAATVAAPAVPGTAGVAVVAVNDAHADGYGDDGYPCPPHHHGLLGDVLIDVFHIVAELL